MLENFVGGISHMRTLLLESATSCGLLALAEEKTIVAQREFALGAKISVPMIPFLDEMLKELDWFVSSLDLIVVGIGPGSYTGIRLAAAIGKGLAYAHSLPLVGVSSLAGFVPSEKEGPFLALLDAKMGGGYWWRGEKRGDMIRFFGEPAVSSLQALLPQIEEGERCVTAEGDRLDERLAALSSKKMGEWEKRFPSARSLLEQGWERERRGEGSKDRSLPLLYLRKTQAEMEREAKEKDP